MKNNQSHSTEEQLLLFYLCEHQNERVSTDELLEKGDIGVKSKEALRSITRSLEDRSLIETYPDGTFAIA